MPDKKISRRAFTLIELLTVIIIIGILIAILVPAFSRMRSQAKMAGCINNLRQIGVAFYLYLDEHNEIFPNGGGSNRERGGNDSDSRWETSLYLYLDDANIFRCPVTFIEMIPTGPSETSPALATEKRGRYGYNGCIGGGTDYSNRQPKNLSNVASPSQTILCVDAVTSRYSSTSSCEPEGPIISYRHLNGANILFVSGAVNWVSKSVIEANTGSNGYGGWWGWSRQDFYVY